MPSSQLPKEPKVHSDREQVDPLWRRYKATGSKESRDALMRRYLPLVKFIADRVAVRLPAEVDVDDLRSAGIFGMADAIEAFDLDRGVKFETYCGMRIRGAILDELRAMDWAPRLARARSNRVNKARSDLHKRFGRAPTDTELARELGVDEQEYARINRDAGHTTLVSLNRSRVQSDSPRGLCELDVLRDRRLPSPLTTLERNDLKEKITRNLSRAERLVVILYYYEGMTMKEIGQTLDLSESRVSQMHTTILARLRIAVGSLKNELENVSQE